MNFVEELLKFLAAAGIVIVGLALVLIVGTVMGVFVVSQGGSRGGHNGPPPGRQKPAPSPTPPRPYGRG